MTGTNPLQILTMLNNIEEVTAPPAADTERATEFRTISWDGLHQSFLRIPKIHGSTLLPNSGIR